MRSSRTQATSAGELVLRIIACTGRTPSSKRCWIGVPPTISPSAPFFRSRARQITLTHAFQDRKKGATHIEMRVAEPKPKDKAFVDQAAAKFKENITKAIGKLQLMLEEQQTPVAVIDEPSLIARPSDP